MFALNILNCLESRLPSKFWHLKGNQKADPVHFQPGTERVGLGLRIRTSNASERAVQ